MPAATPSRDRGAARRETVDVPARRCRRTGRAHHPQPLARRRCPRSPVLLNTSFNVAGEPIVETPEDAIQAFTSTRLDDLAVGAACTEVRPLSGGFEYVLQPGEVGLHEARVACEVLITHVREAAQAEYHLTAVTVGDDSHWVVDDFA